MININEDIRYNFLHPSTATALNQIKEWQVAKVRDNISTENWNQIWRNIWSLIHSNYDK